MGGGRAETIRQLQEVDLRKRLHPLRYATWHRGQDAAMRDKRQAVAMVGGNWSAKTYWLSMEIAGALSGDFPITGMFPDPPLPVIVLGRPDVFRDKLQPIIKSYLPPDSIESSTKITQWQCDSMWVLKNGSTCRFHSFDQGVVEGPEYAVMASDEPPPMLIKNSLMSRLRHREMFKMFGYGAKELYAFTPLGASAYLYDEFGPNHDSKIVGIHHMSIWANCTCLAGLPIDKLDMMGARLGLANEVHAPDCICNGGFKTKGEIFSYLGRISPSELKARETGEWMFLERRKFPYFCDEEPYVFDPAKQIGWRNGYPPDGTLYVGMDPHSARPDAIVIGAAKPDGTFDWLEELPSYEDGEFRGRYFDSITNYYRPTSIVVKRLVQVLKGIGLPIGAMVMDPFRGAQRIGDNGVKIVDSFNVELKKEWPEGPRFRLTAPDKDDKYSIEAGERKINDLLYFDRSQKIGSGNRPRWRYSQRCHNMRRAMLNYRSEETPIRDDKAVSEKAADGFKDFIDPQRYVEMSKPRFIPPVNPNLRSVWSELSPPVNHVGNSVSFPVSGL